MNCAFPRITLGSNTGRQRTGFAVGHAHTPRRAELGKADAWSSRAPSRPPKKLSAGERRRGSTCRQHDSWAFECMGGRCALAELSAVARGEGFERGRVGRVRSRQWSGFLRSTMRRGAMRKRAMSGCIRTMGYLPSRTGMPNPSPASLDRSARRSKPS